MNKKILKILCCLLSPLIILTLGFVYQIKSLPNMIFIREGQSLQSSLIRLSSSQNIITAQKIENDKDNDKKVDLKLLGILPVKNVVLKSVPDEISLYPGGQPIGVKLNTKGVLIVALSDIETENGKVMSPASKAGIQIGDSIVKINGENVDSSEKVAEKINMSSGNELNLTIDREGTKTEKKVKPVKGLNDNGYKIGLWIRDSTAGVGTMTFYCKDNNKFAALGHPITDVDTGTILKVAKGEIVSSSIISIRKGIKGKPGELRGIFINEDSPMGKISKNTKCGIFGTADSSIENCVYNKPLKIALQSEIKEGHAKILTTIDGEKPELYDIQIEKLLKQDNPSPKSMVIKITDKKLLEKTGGIVQGMSGSPIIQNDKLVGAVTHVLINKPDVGYGIYIEWMLKDSDILTK